MYDIKRVVLNRQETQTLESSIKIKLAERHPLPQDIFMVSEEPTFLTFTLISKKITI